MTRVTRDDAGFTLPELLVAIAVAAIVMPAVSMAMISAFRTTTGTTERLAASNDASMMASWFVPDVQSADSFAADDTSACRPSGAAVLFTASRATTLTGYAVVDTADGRTLVRYRCEGGAPEPTVTVAHDLDPTAMPLVTCTPAVHGTCAAATTHVSLTITDRAGYSFTQNAMRRKS